MRIAMRHRMDVTRHRARIASEPRIGIAHRAMPARCRAASQLFSVKRRRDALPGHFRHRAIRARCRIARCRHRAMRDAASRDAVPLSRKRRQTRSADANFTSLHLSGRGEVKPRQPGRARPPDGSYATGRPRRTPPRQSAFAGRRELRHAARLSGDCSRDQAKRRALAM